MVCAVGSLAVMLGAPNSDSLRVMPPSAVVGASFTMRCTCSTW